MDQDNFKAAVEAIDAADDALDGGRVAPRSFDDRLALFAEALASAETFSALVSFLLENADQLDRILTTAPGLWRAYLNRVDVEASLLASDGAGAAAYADAARGLLRVCEATLPQSQKAAARRLEIFVERLSTSWFERHLRQWRAAEGNGQTFDEVAALPPQLGEQLRALLVAKAPAAGAALAAGRREGAWRVWATAGDSIASLDLVIALLLTSGRRHPFSAAFADDFLSEARRNIGVSDPGPAAGTAPSMDGRRFYRYLGHRKG